MALLSLAMKSSHHHAGTSPANFLDVPPSPPLSSPSPSALASVTNHDEDFRSSSTTNHSTSDSDRPLKKRRKQERPSLFVDRRSTSDEDVNEPEMTSSATNHSRPEDANADDEIGRSYGFVWNELMTSPTMQRSTVAESSPEVPTRDSSDKENNSEGNHHVIAMSRNAYDDDDDEDEDEFEKSNAAAAEFRQTIDRLNGRLTADLSATSAAVSGSAAPHSIPSAAMNMATGGLSTAGSMLLRQLVFQNPLQTAAGRNFESLPALMTSSPSSPTRYTCTGDGSSRPTPTPPAQTGDPFGASATASDDGEGMADDGDGGPETCPECQKVFKRRVYLQRHMAREHWSTARVFKCDKCAYETKHQSNLLVHRRTHTGERPYHCGACGQRYTQGHLLKAHIRSRHGSEMAYYNMDKRSDGVRCRRALNAMRAAATVHTTGPCASPQNQRGGSTANGGGSGSGMKEDKIRFLLEAAEASRNNHQQQQQSQQQLLQHHTAVSGPLTTALVPQGPMAGAGPFGGMSLGQYVTALSNCLPQQHQQPHPVPISGSSIIGAQPGFVRGPLIWTPSMNMSLAAAAASAGLIGGPAAAAAAAAFQTSQRQQQHFHNQQQSTVTSEVGLALASHGALLSSLAATPFQPTSVQDSVHQQRPAIVTSASAQRSASGPTDSSSLLSSLLQTTPYSGHRFATPSDSSTTETGSSPSRRRRRTSTTDRQSPEDLSTSSSRRRGVDDDDHEKVAAATSMMTPTMMMSFLSNYRKHMTSSPSPVDQRSTTGNQPVASRPDDDGKTSPTIADGALNLATLSSMPSSPFRGSARTPSGKASENRGEKDRASNDGQKELVETEATDLSARGRYKAADNSRHAELMLHAVQSPINSAIDVHRRGHSPAMEGASTTKIEDAGVLGAELDLSQSKTRKEQIGVGKIDDDEACDDSSSNSSSGGNENCHERSQTVDQLSDQKVKVIPRGVTTCCTTSSPSICDTVCPHLVKLRQLRRNVYRMLSVFTPYLDVAGIGGVADVEADSVDDFLHEVIYSSKLGAPSTPS